MKYLGIVLFVVGLAAMAYFLFSFETTVDQPAQQIPGGTIGTGKINNIGLLNDRECGCIVGAALTIAGAVMGGYAPEAKRS